MDATHFQMRTLKHVGAVMALHVLAYNLKTVIWHSRRWWFDGGDPGEGYHTPFQRQATGDESLAGRYVPQIWPIGVITLKGRTPSSATANRMRAGIAEALAGRRERRWPCPAQNVRHR